MKISPQKLSWLLAAFALLFSTAVGQDRPPLLQDIVVQGQDPLVQKTGSSAPAGTAPVAAVRNPVRTLFPALATVDVPGYSGILVEDLSGKVVMESNADLTFNPASNVKIATAYAVLKTFGPEFRFLTNVYTDGTIDRSTGTLNGNLYVSGKDPMFANQHGVGVANELNKLGIRTVTGNLYVTDNFSINYSGSPSASAQALFNDLDASRRVPGATRAWLEYLAYSGQANRVQGVPSVTLTGQPFVAGVPSSLKLLFTHESTPMKEILKATLCYSNNFLAEKLGDMLGGPYAVARLVQLNANVPPAEFSLATSSGLGYNRVTPGAMMKLLRALRSDLARSNMTFMDIMPVAGLDQGTLEERFAADWARGSVVGKTGTLGNTDGGASALAGEMNTRNGRLLFVIFNMKGSVPRFRSFQNMLVPIVQAQFGGAAPMTYSPLTIESRLARSRFSYPDTGSRGSE
ncbi:MAG TPA: D-alanyl-D-alanine carboxypeptidase [Pyrinomonadaceae bacterium]|jgi:D-alanyl-D-alanine carboxypeptidase/D-alanyl-D-alanine-endopeptidase (penicillin-binding protein 4)|nr:D-alanyl-D-alanine carboxypeptidase [Pyrinomonadaceae bacterium]